MTIAAPRIDGRIRKLALDLHQEGKTPVQIAEQTGLLAKEVRVVLDEAARPAPPPPRRPTAPAPAAGPPPTPVQVGRLAAPGGSFITVLRAGDLFVDHTYQRPVDQARVEKMAAGYDVSLVGIIEVSDRGDGRYAVVDGQHRWAMLTRLDSRGPDTPICCHVHRSLTVEQEAALFRDIDRGRRALTTWDRWHARLAAGEAEVVEIDRLVRSRDLVLSDQIRPGTIRATRTCEEIAALGGVKLLGEVLDALLCAWGHGADTFAAELLMGAALLRAGYAGVDLSRLASELTRTTPQQVGARARALRETQSGTLGRLAAVYMVGLYNRTPGPKLGPLPSAAYYGDLKRRPLAVNS